MAEDFNRVFADNGGKTAISDVDYADGWDFIGDNPPEVEDFNSVMNEQDKKLQDLNSRSLATQILPFGTYTSGTYTIPNGLTWDDFDLIYIVGSNDDATAGRVGNTSALTKEAIAANPTSWEALIQTSSGNTATVSYVSGTQFSVLRSTNDSIRQIYGYLK